LLPAKPWVRALESLKPPLLKAVISVDLKYVLPGQILEVQFEGVRRRFSIANIKGEGEADVVAELNRLSVNGNPQVWITGWDTNVQIINNPAPEPSSQKVRLGLQYPFLRSH
jgi:hypothetical protein